MTNRNKENGGLFSKGERARLSVLLSAIESQPTFIDIELATDKDSRDEILRSARENNVASYVRITTSIELHMIQV